MNSLIRANIIRFFLLVFLQFLLKQVDYVNIDIYIYPLFILLLPLGSVDGLLIVLSFFFGLCIDSFYNTMGLHASAAVFLASIRPFVLRFLEPRGGYENGKALTKHHFGARWFVQYSSILIFMHTVWVVTLEELTLISWWWVLRLIFVFVLSMLVTTLYQYIFNPKD